MTHSGRKRAKIGDVLEIKVPGGFAYLQFSHRKPPFGSLIRVLPGIFEEPPSDFRTLVEERERFFVFFPVGAAINRGIVHIVGHEPIPMNVRPFPLFKVPGLRGPVTGTLRWWLWDGDREWPVTSLTPEQRRLSIRSGVNDTMLVKRIVSGWSPEDECDPN